MTGLTGLLSLLLVLTAEVHIGMSDDASNCGDTKQHYPYTVVCNNGTYEVRHYEPTKWVCSSVKAFDWLPGIFPAFMNLYQWMKANDINLKDPKHATDLMPGNLKLPAGDVPATFPLPKMQDYTLCFKLPLKHKNPLKSRKDVEIVETGERYMYVRSYHGLLTEAKEEEEAQKLFDDINILMWEKNHTTAAFGGPHSDTCMEVWVDADAQAHC
ncbi:unnamed protein product [Knipowitschia caucasica]